ncbi:MAG TPA: ester cyclase [Nitrososphaera sp.]|nr:ester cyclase [Nitrososphaera sp.]
MLWVRSYYYINYYAFTSKDFIKNFRTSSRKKKKGRIALILLFYCTITAVIKAFPDINHNILDLVAEGDKVAARFSITGTYIGEFQGIPHTGKEVSIDCINFLTVIDGKSSRRMVKLRHDGFDAANWSNTHITTTSTR